MNFTTMLNIDVVVVALLAVIMLLLVLIFGFILFSPGRRCRWLAKKKKKQHASHIYETIEDEDDEQQNRVTQVLKFRVSSECGSIQQEMLLRVQVEAIPVPCERVETASTSNFSPPLSPKPLLMHLQQVPNGRLKGKIQDNENAKFGFSMVDLQGLKPIPPPKTPPVKLPITPTMIKDPSLLNRRSHYERENVALVHSKSMEETPGYLQPSSLRKPRQEAMREKEKLTEKQY